jgi:spore germination cell wall hydrolase CwlJ-like protein
MTRCTGPVLLVAVAVAVWPRPEEPLPEPAVRVSTAPERGAVEAELEADTLLLAQVGHGEDPRAVAAVAWVVLTRAGCTVAPLECRRPLLKEVTKHRAFGTMKGGRFRPSWRPDAPAPVRAVAVVTAVLDGRLPDPTGGSTHFHRALTWTPPWAPHPRHWRRVGSHVFYREAR